MNNDIRFMRFALKLGAKGKGSAFPNPPVGAVLVKDGEIIGTGWHRFRGEPHAETVAINDAISKGLDTNGATIFVTLEPCCHRGLTPPCTETLIRAGISRCVISCADKFDDRVCGKGIETLTNAGIEVECGVLEDLGSELIEHYIVQRTEKRAFLTVKWAQTLDGKIAPTDGDSHWISCEKSLKFAHSLRAQHSAIAIGANTAIKDNPELTVRLVRSHNEPARIIIAGERDLPENLKLFSTPPRTIAVFTKKNPPNKLPQNIEILTIEEKPFWKNLLGALCEIRIGSVLLEGGAETLSSAFNEKAVDRVFCITSPKILGNGIDAIRTTGSESLRDAIRIEKTRLIHSGDDIIISGIPRFPD